MGPLLFDPNGRINGRPYWQGVLLLTVASVLITAAANMVAPMISWLNLLLIYPFICVFGKRFHDRGWSAGWAIAVWAATIAIQFLIMVLFIMLALPLFMTPEQMEIMKEVNRLSEAGDLDEAMKGVALLLSPDQMGQTFSRANVVTVGLSIPIMGWFIARLRSHPAENGYGPVPNP